MQACKFCQSKKIVKHGAKAGIQRYLCKDCNHHFYDNMVDFPRMRINSHAIITALNLYFNGLSTRKVAEQLLNIFGEQVSQSTVWYWIQKYSQLASEYAKTLTPTVSGKIHHDETMVKVDGSNKWFWEAIDEETRFLVASYLSDGRSIAETYQLFKRIKEGCGSRPHAIFVDGSNSYDMAFELAFESEPQKVAKVELVKRVGIKARETNNIVERLHGTLKDRLKPMRGMKQMKTAQILLDGYVTHYNFCRSHQAIKQTPAQAAKIQIKGWQQLIEQAQARKTKQQSQPQILEVKVRT